MQVLFGFALDLKTHQDYFSLCYLLTDFQNFCRSYNGQIEVLMLRQENIFPAFQQSKILSKNSLSDVRFYT